MHRISQNPTIRLAIVQSEPPKKIFSYIFKFAYLPQGKLRKAQK